jgi:hypothetical protein
MVRRRSRSGLVRGIAGTLAVVLLTCGGGVPTAGTAAPEAPPPPPPPTLSPNVTVAAVEEQPGYRRATLLDTTGLERPTEATSVLVPTGWNVDGRVVWNLESPCFSEKVRVTMTMTSPDGSSSVRILPAEGWQWSSNPEDRDWMGGGSTGPPIGCRLSPFPPNPADHLEKVVAPALGAQVSSVAIHEPALAELVASAAADAESRATFGGNTRSSAMVGTLRFPDGHVGSVLVAMSVLEWESPNKVGPASRFEITHLRGPIVVELPSGREEEARRILDIVAASGRPSPEWSEQVARAVSPPPSDFATPFESYDKSRDGYCETRGYDQQWDVDCDLPVGQQKRRPEDEWP